MENIIGTYCNTCRLPYCICEIKHPKQVGEIEAVEFAEWIDKNEFTRTITFNFNPLWVSNNIYYSGCQYTTKQLYEIFKNQK